MKERRRIVGSAVVVAAALVAAACLPRFQQPLVRLDGVRVGSMSLRGGTLYAEFIVQNPNGYGLETRSLTYDLEIGRGGDAEPDWVKLADGRLDEPIVVAARDSTRVEVPVDFTLGNLTGIALTLLDRGVLDYRISGTVEVRQPISRRVPYRRTGKVAFDAIR